MSKPLTDREKRWLRSDRAMWRLIASGQWASRLDDEGFRQAVYRLAEQEAAKAHRRLVRNEEAQRTRRHGN